MKKGKKLIFYLTAMEQVMFFLEKVEYLKNGDIKTTKWTKDQEKAGLFLYKTFIKVHKHKHWFGVRWGGSGTYTATDQESYQEK